MRGIERMRLFRATALLAGACVLLGHAAGEQRVTSSAILDSYERAWGQHDVEGALAVLADNAVITFQSPRSRSLNNRQQIRDFIQNGDLQSAPVLTMGRQVDGNAVNWSERIEDQVLGATDLTVQAIVEGGKIQSLVYRSGRILRSPGIPAASVTPQAAGAALAAVVLLAFGLLSLAGVRSRVTSGSHLRGRMMSDLRLWRASPKRAAYSSSPTLLQVSQCEILAAPQRRRG
jgi:hypothetical protein